MQNDEDRRRLQAIPSPCIGVCSLNTENICVGCFRAQEEIWDWLDYSEQERSAALLRVAKRKGEQL